VATYLIGQPVTLRLTLTLPDGGVANPDDVAVTLYAPDGTDATVASGAITALGGGVFDVLVQPDQLGRWRYSAVTAGVVGATEGAFSVRDIPRGAILSVDDFPSVRAVLSATLDEVTLPDVILADPINLRRAEREVIALMPDAATRVGDAAEVVRDATILLLASMVAPTLPSLLSEKGADYEYKLAQTDWNAVADRLRAQAMKLIDPYVEAPLPSAGPPTYFGVAHRDRPRVWAPGGYWR
jgi:hypothetical protein